MVFFMRKDPLFITFLKIFLCLGALFFLAMMWWSYSEQEADINSIKISLEKIENKLKAPTHTAPVSVESKRVIPSSLKKVGDPAYPNLLEEDLYFADVLPKQLGDSFMPHGTLRSATIGKPDNLNPLSNWAQVRAWTGLCITSAARQKYGIFESLSPNMALKMEERAEGAEFWFYLRNDVYWEPLNPAWFPVNAKLAPQFLEKHLVTAHDYKFYFDVFMNPSVSEAGALALRTIYEDIKEVEVIDDFTFVVRWKTPKYVARLSSAAFTPLPRFVYQHFMDGEKIIENDSDPDTYRKNPIWALNFSKHWANNIIVSCGPWIFDGMTDKQIKFKRNPNYFFPLDALTEARETGIRFSSDTIWQDFKEEKLDTYELRPEQFLEFEQFLKSPLYNSQNSKIEKLEFPAQIYTYLGWNQARPWFKSAKVRQALTMSIDRNRIVRQTLNDKGTVIHGTFLSSSNGFDPSIKPWLFDPIRAKQQLEEEGWYDSKGTGIIQKNIDGQETPFRFTLTYYVKNLTSKATVEYIATALEAVGIKVDLNGVDIADLTKVFEDKDFDALLMGWQLGSPPEELRQLWSSEEADKKGSSNAFDFRNKEADDIIEKLDYEKDIAKRTALYRRFDQIIHEEQPYTFLYSPITTLLYRSWMKNIFIPEKRQDLIPGANVLEPSLDVSWIDKEAVSG